MLPVSFGRVPGLFRYFIFLVLVFEMSSTSNGDVFVSFAGFTDWIYSSVDSFAALLLRCGVLAFSTALPVPVPSHGRMEGLLEFCLLNECYYVSWRSTLC